jgi:hypothetical protein
VVDPPTIRLIILLQGGGAYIKNFTSGSKALLDALVQLILFSVAVLTGSTVSIEDCYTSIFL